jgi:hypothetical protein
MVCRRKSEKEEQKNIWYFGKKQPKKNSEKTWEQN